MSSAIRQGSANPLGATLQDTSCPSPRDIYPWSEAPDVPGRVYQVGPRSVVVLLAMTNERQSPSLGSSVTTGKGS
jgi:hypothetical protein